MIMNRGAVGTPILQKPRPQPEADSLPYGIGRGNVLESGASCGGSPEKPVLSMSRESSWILPGAAKFQAFGLMGAARRLRTGDGVRGFFNLASREPALPNHLGIVLTTIWM